MSLTILDQNFYEISDPLNIIKSIRVNSSVLSFNNNIIFISEIGVLSITTQSGTIFSYDVISDIDTEQQIYSTIMQLTGLRYSISSVSEAPTTDTLQDINVAIIHSGSSSIYQDYVFWYNSVEFRVFINNNIIVDYVSFQSTDEIISTGLKTTVSQFGNELVFRMSPTIFNVSQVHDARFKINSGDVIYTTDIFQIVPRDPSLSECVVSGSIYNEGSITELQLTSETISIVLNLRFETWVDDENELRNVLNVFTSIPFNINDDTSFYKESDSVTNTIGLASAINEAVVIKTSEHELTINIGKRIDIKYPERLVVDSTLPNSVIRSAREIPIICPFVQTIYPSPGDLRISTLNSVNYSEKDFWLSEVVITIEIDDDEWQDISLLSDSALSLFITAIKNAFMTDNESWNTMVSNANLTISTETDVAVGLLHIQFPQQSSSTFNIDSAIQIGFNLPSNYSGFHFLVSGATPPSSFFIINAVQSYISVNTAQIIESDIWNGHTTLVLLFVDDELIAATDAITNHVINNLQLVLGVTNITKENTTINHTTSRLTININQGSPSSFSISGDIELSLTFPPSFLRNGNELTSPNISFIHTPVQVSISGIDDLTANDVNMGFTISITLVHDVWMPLSNVDAPVNMTSRHLWPSGWNTRIQPDLSFLIQSDDQSTLLVTIPPNKGYMVRLTEVVDVFLNAGSTRNNSRLYINNFTIQGASQSERALHDYMQNLNTTINNIAQLKSVFNKIKSHTKTRPSQFQTNQDFSIQDTIGDRLQKLNTSNVQNPIAVCKPATLNSVSSNVAHNFVLNTQSILQSIVTTPTPLVSTNKGVPLCLPAITRSMGKQMFNIMLHTQTPILLNHNGVNTQHITNSILLVIDPPIDTVFISGQEIIDTQII